MALNDRINKSVLDRFLGAHPVVSVGIDAHLLVGLSGILGKDPVELFLGADDVLGCDLDLGSLTCPVSG